MDNRTRILLTQLMEECAEVSVNISKVLRFGKDEIKEGLTETNAERVTSEMNDVLGVFKILVDEGILPMADPAKLEEKAHKIEHYMKYSLELLKQ